MCLNDVLKLDVLLARLCALASLGHRLLVVQCSIQRQPTLRMPKKYKLILWQARLGLF